jgi:hypothetical protein
VVGVILQTYSWHLKLDDKRPEAVTESMKALAAILVRTRPVLRGLRLSQGSDGRLHIQMRVAGHTRWAIQSDARKLIIMFLRRVFIAPANLELELVTTERNAKELYLGEGRTPMTKKPRAATKPDGSPWDHYEWWGDDLPRGEQSSGHGHETSDPAEQAPPWVTG